RYWIMRIHYRYLHAARRHYWVARVRRYASLTCSGGSVLRALRTSVCALRSRGPQQVGELDLRAEIEGTERATVTGLRAHVDVSSAPNASTETHLGRR